MPHSSGGGSHGGGSHGGGHHGGYHGSSANRDNSTRTSSRPFRNSRRYTYYHRGTQRSFYAGTDFKPGFQISKILVLLPLILIGLFLLYREIPHIPSYSDHKIVIKDEADVISNEDKVMSELKAFQTKTGITPSVITIYNEVWMGSNPSLEDYAYNRYLSEFSDEMHWLIVYSQPNVKQDKRMYWHWEGMQGDKTDSVLTVNAANSFNNDFQRYLNDNESFDDALTRSFAELTDEISMKPDWEDLVFPLFILAMAAFRMIAVIYQSVKYRNAVPAPLFDDTGAYGGTGSTYNGTNSTYNSTGGTYNGANSTYNDASSAYNSTGGIYGSSTKSGPYISDVYADADNKPYDPQAERRRRIIDSGQNYTFADYKADKKERDAEFHAFINQYEQLIPDDRRSNVMPTMGGVPSSVRESTPDSSDGMVTCQYCGSAFAEKYKKCPFCNAKR